MIEQRKFDLDEYGRVESLRMQFENHSCQSGAHYCETVDYTVDPERGDWTLKTIHCIVYCHFNPFGMRRSLQEWVLQKVALELEV